MNATDKAWLFVAAVFVVLGWLAVDSIVVSAAPVSHLMFGR